MRTSSTVGLLGALLLIPSLASAQSGTILYERSLTRTPDEARAAFGGARGGPDGQGAPPGIRPEGARPGGQGGPGGAGGRAGEREPIQEYSTLTVTYNGSVASTRIEPIASDAPQAGGRGGFGGPGGARGGAAAQRFQQAGGGAGIPAMPVRRTTSVWVDVGTGERVESVDFMGRNFRIRSEHTPLAWRLVGEESEFLGYRVQKATAEDGERAIEAWFTIDVPGFAAPEGYSGLPGTVLMVSVDRGATLIQAVEVEVDEGLDAPEPPDDGDEMSAADFDALVAEKTEEYRQEMQSLMQRRRGGGQ